MGQEERDGARLTSEELGENFEAQSTPSYGGELGASFEEHNSSREEWEKYKHRGRRRIIWIAALALILIVALVVFFWTRPKKGAPGAAGAGAPAGAAAGGGGGRRGQTGPAAITVGEATTGNINIYVDALGTVTPLNTVTIYSQITGKVIAVHYKEGQIVHKGAPLIDIDPEPYRATLTQAQGTLKRDQGVLEEAQMDLKRYQDAFAKNAIARQQLEDQEKVVTQDEGTVITDQGTVKYDEVQLAYCHIVSPITGRVGLRLVDPGNTVFSGTGSTLVVVTQLQPITVVFNVSEDSLPQVQAQLKVGHTLETDAFDRGDDKILEKGRLTSLDNQIDTTTGTVKFRATFANGDLGLFPNQFVNARLLVKTLVDATLVPSGAVQHNGTATFVYLVKPDAKKPKETTVAVQAITVLTSNETVTAVTGIQPGTKIATSGFDRLESGAHVQVQGAGQKVQGGALGAPAPPASDSETGGTSPAGGTGTGTGGRTGNGTGAGNGPGSGNGSGAGNGQNGSGQSGSGTSGSGQGSGSSGGGNASR